MRVCSFRHLTQAQIEPFSEQDVEQTDPVATWSPGSQMGKNASVKPRAASTSSSMSVIRTDGIRRYRSSMSASAPSGTSAVNLSIRNVPSFYATVRNSAVTGSPASRLRAIVSRAFLSASQSCGLEGTASFAFSCAAIIGTSTCLRSP